jgi:hypothetical protein
VILGFGLSIAQQEVLLSSFLGSSALLELLVEFLESQASLLHASLIPFEGVWLSRTLFLPPL